MKLSFRLASGVVLCLALTSCIVTSKNPLSPFQAAQPDPNLLGTWHPKDEADEVVVFSITDAHWMRVVDQKKDKPAETYDAFVTVIGKERFLNVLDDARDEKGNVTGHHYFLMRYEVSSKHLSTWWVDQDKAASAIRKGLLKGTIHENKGSALDRPSHPDVDVTLNDSSANMSKFIEQKGSKELFSKDASSFGR